MGIAPALSAWEMACHACCHMDFPGQPPFQLVRRCPSNTGLGSCIGHAAGTLKASGHEAVDEENDHAYDRPNAEYPDDTRLSLRAGAASGKPRDHHAYGNEDRAHREYPPLGCLPCARCCCLTQCHRPSPAKRQARLPPELLRRWQGNAAAQRRQLSSYSSSQVDALTAEIRDLEEENKIVRRAAAAVAEVRPSGIGYADT